jgi:hypothetical protein
MNIPVNTGKRRSLLISTKMYITANKLQNKSFSVTKNDGVDMILCYHKAWYLVIIYYSVLVAIHCRLFLIQIV